MIDINLLPKANVLSQKEKNLRQKIKIGLIISSSITVLILIFLLITNGILAVRLNQQKQKREDLMSQFAVQSQTANSLRKLKDKISGIKTVRFGQTDFAAQAASVSALLTPGINFKAMSLDKAGKVNLTATAADLASLQVFLPAIKAPFNKIILSGLRLTKNNSLDFSLEMTYELAKN